MAQNPAPSSASSPDGPTVPAAGAPASAPPSARVPTREGVDREGGGFVGGRDVWLVIGALLIGLLIAALDQTVVSTALPTIVADFGGLEHLSWVVTAYLLAATAATPLWGKLGDMYGRKKLYQSAIVIFLVGSVLCGVAQGMGQLVVFRAVQGLGGGGLMVLSMAIVGDVVPPRDRGRYQGLFGAVFGATSVLGPLLGGLFVDHLSWRWVFYVNLPIGVVALAVVAVVMRLPARRSPHRIDYPGTLAMASAVTCLVLLTSLGGTTWAWNSWEIVLLAVLGAAFLAVFVRIERRAAEPVLPLRLFRLRTFSLCAVIGFVVGFAMFGALTYLPTFLQVVHGVSATMSGVHMLPMVLGLLIAVIGSGQIVSRTGRYKVFPVLGSGVTVLGLLLLHRLDEHSETAEISVSFAVFGLGLGLVMQVLILIVQNTVGYEDLGVATSGATFFRSIGASFGVAVFGAIFAGRLGTEVAEVLRGRSLPPGVDAEGLRADASGIRELPADLREGVLAAYSTSITTVFLWAVPAALLAFVLAWFLREQPLRGSVTAPELAETVGANPVERSSLDEIARGLTLLGTREARRDLYTRITAFAGLDLYPGASWIVLWIRRHGPVDPVALAERTTVPTKVIVESVRQLEERRLATRDGFFVLLTQAGEAVADRLVEARRTALARMLGDWEPERHGDLAEMLTRLTIVLCGDDGDRPQAPRSGGRAGPDRGRWGA